MEFITKIKIHLNPKYQINLKFQYPMTKIITAVVLYRSGCHASPGSVISDWIRERDDGCAVWNLVHWDLFVIWPLVLGIL